MSGVVDSGGLKRVDCTDQNIPPATPTFTWTITPPPPLAPINGSGPVATITATDPGDYSATFTATVSRDCAPAPLTVGPVTATVGDIDIDGDGNHDGIVEASGEDDTLEDVLPGVIVLCNVDDDNEDGIADNADGAVNDGGVNQKRCQVGMALPVVFAGASAQ